MIFDLKWKGELLAGVACIVFLFSLPLTAYAQNVAATTQSRSGETQKNQNRDDKQTQNRGNFPATQADDDLAQGRYKIGSFWFDPSMSVTGIYDDNIFYTRVTPTADFISVYEPHLGLSSAWDKNALNLYTGAALGRYRTNGKENYNDYYVGADGRIDIAPRHRLFGGVQYNRLHEGRESPDDVLGVVPTEYDMTDVYAGYQRQFSAVGVQLGATFQDYDFDDVAGSAGTINNDDRDRRESEFGIRLVKPVRDTLKLFVQDVMGWRHYGDAVDDTGLDRDSKGGSLNVGAIYTPYRNLSVEFMGGFLAQMYDDPSLPDSRHPDFGAKISWSPDAYSGLAFNLDRRIKETTLAGSSGYLSTSGTVDGFRYLSQEVMLGADFYYTENGYDNVDRKDYLIGTGVNVRHYFTPHIYGSLGYDFSHRDSNQAGFDFYDNRVYLQLAAELNPKKWPEGLAAGLGEEGSLFFGAQSGHGTMFTSLDGPRGAGGTVVADLGDQGSVYGLFAGYDRFFGNWFLGGEGQVENSRDFDWSHIETGDRVFDVTRKQSASLHLRAGYRQPNNVSYFGHVGGGWTGFDTYYDKTGSIYTHEDNEFALQFGGGVEAPLSNPLFVRMDYTYASYEDYGLIIPSGTDHFDNSDVMMRLGLVYRLGVKDEKNPAFKHDFSGAYLGGNLGYGGFAARNNRVAGGDLSVDRAGHGGDIGSFAGYGYSFGPVYLGLEGMGELSYADWNLKRDPTGRVYSARKEWAYGGDVRAGYVFNDTTLVYGRAGKVISQFDINYVRGGNEVHRKDNVHGTRVGGGVEVAASAETFVRMDYTYTDYDDYTVDYVTGIDTFKPTESVVRLGYGVRF